MKLDYTDWQPVILDCYEIHNFNQILTVKKS